MPATRRLYYGQPRELGQGNVLCLLRGLDRQVVNVSKIAHRVAIVHFRGGHH